MTYHRSRPPVLAGLLLAAVVTLSGPIPAVRAGLVENALDSIAEEITTAASRQQAESRPAPDVDTHTLEGGRTLYMTGHYGRAEQVLRNLAGEQDGAVSASVLLADVLAIQGEYDQAIQALEKVAEAGTTRGRWHLAMAQALRSVGKYETALTHASKACELRPRWAPPILARGRLLETLGRRDEAVKVYEGISGVMEGDSYRKNAQQLVALGQILDRHAVLSGRKASEQAANILHNYFQEAYQRVDESYWPANVAAGVFLQSKHRDSEAMKEFELAHKQNDRLPSVHVGRAARALENWQFETCLKEVEKARKINPNSVDAHLLEALCHMQWRKFEKVPAILDKALEVNPNHLDALSLMAAAHIRMDQPDKARPFVDRVKEINTAYAGLPTAIGEWLAAGRQFDRAETYYRQAIELAGHLAEPHAGLGLLYMQTGEEARAKKVLKRAHELDDFRADVVNYLRLLDKLEDYQVRETEHFVIKVDGERDAVLLGLVGDYMERVYNEVITDFACEPSHKTIIEILPTHAEFSVRITGRGWIGTVGACTGRVIALVAPTPEKERSRFGTHNWATVLRHEFAHAVTLEATGNRIPHWFTEACAVWQQPDRRNYEAVQQLVKAVREDRLFPVRELDWGFIRPKRRGDRGLAYAQAEWMLEYIITQRGFGVVSGMLEGFREGMSQEDVFEKIVQIPADEFDQGFQKWAREQVRQWGFEPEGPPELARAAKDAEAHPEDPDTQAAYAVALYAKRQMDKAGQAARKTLELQPDNVRGLAVLAAVLAHQESHAEAIEMARRLDQVDPSSSVAPRVLAQCYLAERQWLRATAALELLKRRQPLDPYSYEQLARIYMQLGQPEKALPNLIELHGRTMTDPKYARQVAGIYQSMGRPELALDYFRQILQINPYEASAWRSMAAIHLSRQEYDQALQASQSMTLLQPDSATGWTYVAVVGLQAGRTNEDRQALLTARDAAEKARDLDPDGRGGDILQQIEMALEQMPQPADS